MRVLIVNQYAITPALGGGTRHYEVARRLRERGHDVVVVTSRFVHFTHRYEKGEPRPVWWTWLWSTPYLGNVSPGRLFSSLVFALNVLAWGVTQRRFDVVVGSSPDPFVAFTAYCVAAIKHSRFVLEVRDLWPETLRTMGVRVQPILWLMGVLMSLMYRKATSVIALTPGVYEQLGRRLVPGKVVLIPNGVDITAFESTRPPQEVRRQLGLADEFVLLYAGNHSNSYGLDTILDAAALLRAETDILFCLMGSGPEKPRLQQLAVARALTNVRFLDAVPKHEIPHVLSAVDACIESQAPQDLFAGAAPNKLYDYLASNKPILCINKGDGWRLVEGAGAGLYCEPGNAQDIAAGAYKLARDSALRHQLSGKGRSFVESRFSLDALAESFERVLRSV